MAVETAPCKQSASTHEKNAMWSSFQKYLEVLCAISQHFSTDIAGFSCFLFSWYITCMVQLYRLPLVTWTILDMCVYISGDTSFHIILIHTATPPLCRRCLQGEWIPGPFTRRCFTVTLGVIDQQLGYCFQKIVHPTKYDCSMTVLTFKSRYLILPQFFNRSIWDIGRPIDPWPVVMMKNPVARLQHVQAPKDWDLVGFMDVQTPSSHMGVTLNDGSPQNTPKWSVLVGKAIVIGYHYLREPHIGNITNSFPINLHHVVYGWGVDCLGLDLGVITRVDIIFKFNVKLQLLIWFSTIAD